MLSVYSRRLVAGARDVFGVAAAVLVNALGRQLQHAVYEAVAPDQKRN